MRAFLSLVGFVSFASVVGCSGSGSTAAPIGDDGGGGGDGATADGGAVTADQACTDLAAARCAKIQACSAKDFTARFPDMATCTSRQKTICLNGLAAPSTGATPASAEGCAAAFPSWACNDYFADNAPAACMPSKGTLASGASCFFDAQCQTAWCSIAANAACGKCQDAPKAGDSCAVAPTCGANLVCPNSSNVCTAPVAQGAPCDKDAPCAVGLSCVGAKAMTKGACQPIGATVGAACDATRATAAECSNVDGLYCDTMTKQCAALTLVAAGQPCGVVSGAVVGCAAGASCSIGTGKTNDVCAAPAADGAQCDTATGPGCLAPARCVVATGTVGTCQIGTAATCM